jgi:hypothetical protein
MKAIKFTVFVLTRGVMCYCQLQQRSTLFVSRRLDYPTPPSAYTKPDRKAGEYAEKTFAKLEQLVHYGSEDIAKLSQTTIARNSSYHPMPSMFPCYCSTQPRIPYYVTCEFSYSSEVLLRTSNFLLGNNLNRWVSPLNTLSPRGVIVLCGLLHQLSWRSTGTPRFP